MSLGGVENSELKRLQEKLNRIAETKADKIMRGGVDELSKYAFGVLVKHTPVRQTDRLTDSRGNNWEALGEPKGTLKQSWKIDSEIKRDSTGYTREIRNEAKGYKGKMYASFVEEGHAQTPGRFVPAIGKKLKASEVKAVHFVKDSETEIEREQDKLLAKYFDKKLEEAMNDK